MTEWQVVDDDDNDDDDDDEEIMFDEEPMTTWLQLQKTAGKRQTNMSIQYLHPLSLIMS